MINAALSMPVHALSMALSMGAAHINTGNPWNPWATRARYVSAQNPKRPNVRAFLAHTTPPYIHGFHGYLIKIRVEAMDKAMDRAWTAVDSKKRGATP